MRNRLLPFLILIGLPVAAWSQANLTWKHLADVTLEQRYIKGYSQKFLVPIFGETPKSYEGKEVRISGYVIPLDDTVYALSRNPYAACFFCGAAGPETIVELQLVSGGTKRYKMDQWMTFKGILRLNDSDVSHFNYILEKAVPVN